MFNKLLSVVPGLREIAAPNGTGSTQEGSPPAEYARIMTRGELANLRPAYIGPANVTGYDPAAGMHRVVPLRLADGIVVATIPGYEHSDQAAHLDRLIGSARSVTHARVVVDHSVLVGLSASGRTQASERPGRDSSSAAAFWAIVQWAVEHGASDLHLALRSHHSTSSVHVHIGGQYLLPSRYRELATDTMRQMLSVAWQQGMSGAGQPAFNEQTCQQGAMERDLPGLGRVLVRWASLPTAEGCCVTLRPVLKSRSVALRRLDELGYLPSQVAALDRAQHTRGGATIISGVPGSGKSMTLAAMVWPLAGAANVISLEDPVEYLIPGAHQVSVIRDLNAADESGEFASALRTIKRSAPDVLLLGEIRDPQTGRAFMDLVAAGIDIYTTTHADSLSGIPRRLSGEFIGVPKSFLAGHGILKLLMHQALLPRLCPQCRLRADDPDVAEIYQRHIGPGASALLADRRRWVQGLADQYGVDPTRFRVRNPAGCTHCRHPDLPDLSGYAGRIIIAEHLEPASCPEVFSHILSGDTHRLRQAHSAMRHAPYDDADMTGKSLAECALYRALCGEVEAWEIRRFGELTQPGASLSRWPPSRARAVLVGGS